MGDSGRIFLARQEVVAGCGVLRFSLRRCYRASHRGVECNLTWQDMGWIARVKVLGRLLLNKPLALGPKSRLQSVRVRLEDVCATLVMFVATTLCAFLVARV